MASPAYRAAAHNSSGGTTDNVLIAKPAGTVDGDIMIALLYGEPQTQVITSPTSGNPPGTWTTFARLQNAGYPFCMELFWKRCDGEPANYTFAESGSSWAGGSIFSVSGAVASGDPIDVVGADNTGNSTDPIGLDVTTLTAETLLCYTHMTGDGITATKPAGMTTEHFDNAGGTGNTYLATLAVAAAGAVGAQQALLASTNQWAAVLFAIRSTAGAPAPTPVFPFHMPFLGRRRIRRVRG